jgi:glycosyltransferase involved in cell wall biosynthesis
MDTIEPVLARDDWILGVVALFRPLKGLETLVRAIAELRRRGRRVLLKAVGAFESESYQRRIERLVLELDLRAFITWTGFLNDVRAELNTFDLFVLPSVRSEGMPMAILEAMAAGVPVVSTRVEGVSELIRDGVDGVLVEPGNSVALADGIERLLDGRSDLQRVRESALMRQRTEFSAGHMAARVHEVYQQCIPQQRE